MRPQSYLKDGDGTYGDKDDHSDVYFRSELPAIVGIVVSIVLFRVVEHIVIVPPSIFILDV